MWKCSEMVMEQPSAPLHWANVSVFSKSLKVWAFLFFPATGTSHGHICLPLPWHWRQKLLGWWFQTPLESSSHLLESVSFSFRFLRVSPSPCSSFIPFFCLSLFFFTPCVCVTVRLSVFLRFYFLLCLSCVHVFLPSLLVHCSILWFSVLFLIICFFFVYVLLVSFDACLSVSFCNSFPVSHCLSVCVSFCLSLRIKEIAGDALPPITVFTIWWKNKREK